MPHLREAAVVGTGGDNKLIVVFFWFMQYFAAEDVDDLKYIMIDVEDFQLSIRF